MAFRRRRPRAKRTLYAGTIHDSASEANFSALLELRRLAGEIKSWKHHPKAVMLASCGPARNEQLWYTPDHEVELNDGKLEYYDVKGFFAGDRRRRMRVVMILWNSTQKWPLLIVNRNGEVTDIFARKPRAKKGKKKP